MIDFAIIVFILLVISALTQRKVETKRAGFWLMVSILYVLYALRGPLIGNDTHEYIRLFNETNTNVKFDTTNDGRYEIGYMYLNYLLKLISDNHQIVFIVAGAFIYYSFGRFILKYSKIPWLSLFLFFTYGLFTFTFTALRQGIALALCLYAFEALMKNRNILFIAIVLLASYFHNTAIIFFVAYLCKIFKPSKKFFLAGYFVAIILLILFAPLLNYIFQLLPMYEHYTEGTYIGEVGVAAFLYATLSTGILIFSYHTLYNNRKKMVSSKINSYGMIAIMIAIILYIVSIKANIFDRMAIYFNMFAIIILPNAVAAIKSISRQYVTIAIVAIFILYESMILLYRPGWVSIFPYSFYWQH